MSEDENTGSGIVRAEDEPVPNFHTLLIALYPIIGLYAHNIDKTPIAALLRPVFVSAVFVVLLIAVCRRVTGDRYKGGIAATVIAASIFSGWSVLLYLMAMILPAVAGQPDWVYYAVYTAVFIGIIAYLSQRPHAALWKVTAGTAIALLALMIFTDLVLSAILPRGHAWFIAAYFILIASIVVWIARSGRDFRGLAVSLNWFGLVLIAVSFLNVFYNAPDNAPFTPPPALEGTAAATDPNPLPDIYCIVAGGQARSDVHQVLYGIDDSELIDPLREAGLTVVTDSVANYPSTLFSVASCLNMDYLQNLPVGDAPTTTTIADSFHNSRVMGFLKDRGYRIIVGVPMSDLMDPGDAADESILPDRALSEFEVVLIENSAFGPLFQAIHYFRFGSVAEVRHIMEHGRVYQLFDLLSAIPQEKVDAPRFVLAIMQTPEAPFVFDSTGGWPESTGMRTYAGRPEFVGTQEDYRRRYEEQLRFIDKQLANVAQRIKESPRDAVVIIMSAHGPSSALVGDARSLDVRERFSNLIAIGSFGENAPAIDVPNQLSVVNIFRVVLNDVFGTQIPMAENEVFMVRADEPLRFERITNPAPEE